MSADKDIVERLQSAGHFYAPPHDAILYEAAAEIGRLRGEAESMEQMARMQAARADAAEREVTHLRSIAPAEAKGDAYGVFFTTDDGRTLRISGYVGDTETEVLGHVLARARREGFTGTAQERMAELGWRVEPMFRHAPPPACGRRGGGFHRSSEGSTPRMDEGESVRRRARPCDPVR